LAGVGRDGEGDGLAFGDFAGGVEMAGVLAEGEEGGAWHFGGEGDGA